MVAPNGTPKNMSSRLMNMKFMQRAAASGGSSPSTPPEPAAKKQRLSNGSFKSSPASTPRSDAEIVADAQAADEQRREAAFAREAAARGDFKWYLSFQEPQSSARPSHLRVVSAGYGTLDAAQSAKDRSSEDEAGERPHTQVAGRRSFGKFNKIVEKQHKGEETSSSDGSSDSASEDDESDDPDGVNALIAAERKQAGEKARAERKAKRKSEGAEAARMAEERRKKEVNLNDVTSISGFGGGGARKSSGIQDRVCHQCGQKGHMKYQCPQTDDWKRKRGLI